MTARWRWFSALWGLTVLFHLLNAGPAYRMFVHPRPGSWWGMAIGGFALVLVARPDWLSPLVALGVAVPILAWFEAPVMGNHWLVVTLISIGFLAALATAAVRTRSTGLNRRDVESALAPIARGVFFVFYTCTALSKINRAFLTPFVSCATFFTDETARSLGWRSLDTAASPFWGRVIAVAVIAIELSVVVLLIARRTRVLGVFVAVIFHGIIGLDGSHSFADFSSLVYALLVLFLPTEFFEVVRGRLGQWERFTSRAIRLVLGIVLALVVVLQGLALSAGWTSAMADLRNIVWRLFSLGAALVIGWFLVHRRGIGVEASERISVLPAARWVLVIPLLALLNGVTPYVGVKTAYSWNMYSNLVTAPGRSNGLLVPTSWQWTSRQRDLVRVVDSSDASLRLYATEGYLLTMTALRSYTASHPDTSLTYERDGVRVTVPSTAADPLLSRPVGEWEKRVFAYRSIDADEPVRCQPYFLPAG